MNARTSRFTLLLLAGLAVLATGCSAATTGTVTATPTSGASGPAPAISATAPATSGTAQATSAGQDSPLPSSPGTGSPAGATACTPAQLRLLPLGGGLVSGGTDIYYVYFKNTGSTACTLGGYPAVTAVTGPDGSASQVGPAAAQSAAYPAATQLLRPGQLTRATLSFATGNLTSSQCHPVQALFLKIVPPGATTADYAGIDEKVCSTDLPIMTITAVYPNPAS
jgi:hypothetical protein